MSPIPLWKNEVANSVCAMISAGQDVSYSDVLKADRSLAKEGEDNRSKNLARSVTIALGGNVATDFLAPGLRVGLAALGVNADIHTTSYSNWVSEALAGDVTADFWVIWTTAIGATQGGIRPVEYDASIYRSACEKIMSRGSKVIMIFPEALEMEDDPFSSIRTWREKLASHLNEILPDEVIRLPVDHLLRRLGAEKWFGSRYWTMAKAPCHPDGATLVALDAARTISQALSPRVKAVICDLDDTLWGGIIGDDGVDEIKLDPFGEGRPYLAMQQFLKDVRAKGIPLNIVSKNEPENAREPFNIRPEMILKHDDFVYFEASWEPKHVAIRKISEQLNLGLNNICFLDDSPHERNEVRAFIPELIVPELSEDPEQRVGNLVRSGLFVMPVIHRDDVDRVERYQTEKKRQSAQKSNTDIDKYLSELDMNLAPAPITASNISRAEALVQKTNQFNLSNRRHTSAEILATAENRNTYAYCFSLTDRFGDSGIISVVLGQAEDERLVIDTWVLSCRVFGRGVEQAILDHILHWMEGHGLTGMDCEFIPSAKNFHVKEFLTRSGFADTEVAAPRQVFILDNLTTPQHFLTIVD